MGYHEDFPENLLERQIEKEIDGMESTSGTSTPIKRWPEFCESQANTTVQQHDITALESKRHSRIESRTRYEDFQNKFSNGKYSMNPSEFQASDDQDMMHYISKPHCEGYSDSISEAADTIPSAATTVDFIEELYDFKDKKILEHRLQANSCAISGEDYLLKQTIDEQFSEPSILDTTSASDPNSSASMLFPSPLHRSVQAIHESPSPCPSRLVPFPTRQPFQPLSVLAENKSMDERDWKASPISAALNSYSNHDGEVANLQARLNHLLHQIEKKKSETQLHLGYLEQVKINLLLGLQETERDLKSSEQIDALCRQVAGDLTLFDDDGRHWESQVKCLKEEIVTLKLEQSRWLKREVSIQLARSLAEDLVQAIPDLREYLHEVLEEIHGKSALEEDLVSLRDILNVSTPRDLSSEPHDCYEWDLGSSRADSVSWEPSASQIQCYERKGKICIEKFNSFVARSTRDSNKNSKTKERHNEQALESKSWSLIQSKRIESMLAAAISLRDRAIHAEKESREACLVLHAAEKEQRKAKADFEAAEATGSLALQAERASNAAAATEFAKRIEALQNELTTERIANQFKMCGLEFHAFKRETQLEKEITQAREELMAAEANHHQHIRDTQYLHMREVAALRKDIAELRASQSRLVLSTNEVVSKKADERVGYNMHASTLQTGMVRAHSPCPHIAKYAIMVANQQHAFESMGKLLQEALDLDQRVFAEARQIALGMSTWVSCLASRGIRRLIHRHLKRTFRAWSKMYLIMKRLAFFLDSWYQRSKWRAKRRIVQVWRMAASDRRKRRVLARRHIASKLAKSVWRAWHKWSSHVLDLRRLHESSAAIIKRIRQEKVLAEFDSSKRGKHSQVGDESDCSSHIAPRTNEYLGPLKLESSSLKGTSFEAEPLVTRNNDHDCAALPGSDQSGFDSDLINSYFSHPRTFFVQDCKAKWRDEHDWSLGELSYRLSRYRETLQRMQGSTMQSYT